MKKPRLKWSPEKQVWTCTDGTYVVARPTARAAYDALIEFRATWRSFMAPLMGSLV